MILVTGATGLLGSNLLFELSKSEESLRALYRSEHKIAFVKKLFIRLDALHGEERFSKIEWLKGDVLDLISLDDAISGVSHVYHCAAMVSFRRRDFHQLIQVNRKGTANVVNVCLEKGIQKLCYVSSTAAVGKVKINGHFEVRETNKWVQTPDLNGYSNSKHMAENEVWRGMEEGLNAVIINPSVLFGPGDWNESSLTIFRTVANGLHFYTNGSNAFVDVRDVVETMIFLMNEPVSSERFLCTGTNVSFKDLLTYIAQAMNKKPPGFFANPFLSALAWRLVAIAELFGKKPTLTKESVHSSQQNVLYHSDKLLALTKKDFRPLHETICYTIENQVK